MVDPECYTVIMVLKTFEQMTTQTTFVVTGALRLTCFSLQELELLKRDFKNLEKDCSSLKEQMDIKDRLLQVKFCSTI